MPYPFFQNYPMYLQQQQNIQQPTQIQNGGFVVVKDVNEAMNYPVAPGNSVTFKNESQPYIYTKTLGFSQLDQPIFEVFRLVKEDMMANSEQIVEEKSVIEYLSIEDADVIRNDIAKLRSEIELMRASIEIPIKEVKSEK